MGISCSCSEEGIMQTGIRLVTCRTPRKCGDCGKNIVRENSMYHVSFYNFDNMKTSSPLFVCEECGDLSINIFGLGLCFSWGEIKEQWEDFRGKK